MELLFSVFFIAGAILVGAISPGPSFVLIARIAMGTSKNDAIWASIGMGIGGVIFSLLALMGIHIILMNTPTLFFAFKLLGGMYLVYISILIYKGANKPLHVPNEQIKKKSSLKKSFLLGLLTQISNPKAAIAYSSIFAALLPPLIEGWVYLLLPSLIFMVEAGWYLLVTLTLSSKIPRTRYLKSKSLIDKTSAVIMGGLGTKLLFSIAD
jgi:threonine/homoserine/homoserine lactone efflux protein